MICISIAFPNIHAMKHTHKKKEKLRIFSSKVHQHIRTNAGNKRENVDFTTFMLQYARNDA